MINSVKVLKKLNKIDKIIKKHTIKTMAAALLIKNELAMFKEINIENNEQIINVNLRLYTTINDTYKKFKEIIENALKLYEH